MSEYNMPPIDLFGKRCRIKHVSDLERGFVYRIVASGTRSNFWKELPLGRYGDESIQHDNMEDIVYVVCDTLIDEHSQIERAALKDIEIMQGETIDKVKQAQEQQDVLDKIRAEIEQMDFDFGDFYDHTDTIKEMVLEIIDKYKAESEIEQEPKTGHWVE